MPVRSGSGSSDIRWSGREAPAFVQDIVGHLFGADRRDDEVPRAQFPLGMARAEEHDGFAVERPDVTGAPVILRWRLGCAAAEAE